MGRLIDADALIEEIRNGDKVASFNYFLSLVQAQPTAYDKEKVIAQIQEEKFGRCDDSKRVLGYAQEYVREGGVE